VSVLLAPGGRWETIDAVKRRAVLSKREEAAASQMGLRKAAWIMHWIPEVLPSGGIGDCYNVCLLRNLE
jgi:hypothetical protein